VSQEETMEVSVLKVLKGHQDFVTAVLFLESISPNTPPTFLASAGDDITIRIWNWKTGDCIGIIGVPQKVVTMQFLNGVLGCGMSGT
jgi:WD40 repeat protein